ncbi:MAG: VOC family protein [Candidatus Angelobacter sp.]
MHQVLDRAHRLENTVEIPDGDKIGFVLLQKDGLELMYQSYASVEKDNAVTAKAARRGPTFLYVEVADLDMALSATKGAEIAMPVRTTFYGAKEFGIKDPVGHYIIFAQQGTATQQ